MVPIVFEMWAECAGEDECRALAEHFDGLRHTLLTGREVRWEASAELPELAVSVLSADLSSSGVRTLTDALETSEAGLRLYAHLRSAPPFRFARVAFEAGITPMKRLGGHVIPLRTKGSRLDVECVMDDALYRQLGSPNFCAEFRPGYWWTYYRGESYRPLLADDQPALKEIRRGLFPEFYAYRY
jgi:hypothetical protein